MPVNFTDIVSSLNPSNNHVKWWVLFQFYSREAAATTDEVTCLEWLLVRDGIEKDFFI